MTTYLKIIDILKQFSVSHKQLNTFFSGKQYDFQAKENLYPALIVLPVNGIIQKGESEIVLNIILADLLKSDMSNLDDIYSDMFQIAQDIFATLNNSDIDIFIDESGFSVESFQESMDDILAGWILTITIKFPFSGNSCLIPTV